MKKENSKHEGDITPLEKELNTFYSEFYRKGNVESYPDRLVYDRINLGLQNEFKEAAQLVIDTERLDLKVEVIRENGVFFNKCVVSKK